MHEQNGKEHTQTRLEVFYYYLYNVVETMDRARERTISAK